MEETRFIEELEKYDPSLWLVRRTDGEGYTLMGFDLHRNPYCVIDKIGIGNLGPYIFKRLTELNTFRNGDSVYEAQVKRHEAMHKENDAVRDVCRNELKDKITDVVESRKWKDGNRVSMFRAGSESITVTDSRRVLQEA